MGTHTTYPFTVYNDISVLMTMGFMNLSRNSWCGACMCVCVCMWKVDKMCLQSLACGLDENQRMITVYEVCKTTLIRQQGWDVFQLVDSSPSVLEALGWIPKHHIKLVVTHACNPSIQC